MTRDTADGAGSVLWFRRDLRLRDHPAFLAAALDGPVVALFVLDDVALRGAGPLRRAWLYRTLQALDADLRRHGGALVVRAGSPADVVPQVARDVGAARVHVSADFTPYGVARDDRVRSRLAAAGRELVETGSPYAVAPGRVLTSDGRPYQVFTPFYRAWAAHGCRAPAASVPSSVTWRVVSSEPIPSDPLPDNAVPPAGEDAALSAWSEFRENGLRDYPRLRDRPDLDATSHLSAYLKLGAIHPRTILAELGPDDGAFARQLAWREFYGHVLFGWPGSAREDYRATMSGLSYDDGAEAERRFAAWAAGSTGYPMVDAAMRQLLATGWMHNRLRMLTASFLVKDLHLDWRRGARHFMRHLLDADLANNQHGWQWVAGTGTDAAPYHRVFNPVTQGKRHDPDGGYVRRWVPELAGVPADQVHAPWSAPEGPPINYPAPIVDHGVERAEALARYAAATAARRLS